MKRAPLAIGLALVVAGTTIPTHFVDAQFIKNPGQGAAIIDLVLRRNFVTFVDDGNVTGLHPNEIVFAGDIDKLAANPRGQTVFVANERSGSEYYAGPGQTTFILDGPSRTEPLIEECLIFDIAGNTLSARSTDANSSAWDLNPVIVSSYQVGPGADEVTVEMLDGKIIATDNATGHLRITGVEWSNGTPVSKEILGELVIINDRDVSTLDPIAVGPGGSRSLRVVTDDPATHIGGNTKEIVVVGSKVKEVVKSVRGTPQDDIFYVRAEAQWPELELDGAGGFDTYIIRSPESQNKTGSKIPAHYIQEVTNKNGVTVVLADFVDFETYVEPDGSTRFYEPSTGRTQILTFVDRDGNPVTPDGETNCDVRSLDYLCRLTVFSGNEFGGR